MTTNGESLFGDFIDIRVAYPMGIVTDLVGE